MATLVIAAMLMLAPATADAQIQFSASRREDPVQFAASEAYRFADGESDVWVLRGDCYVNQGLLYARSRAAVLWIRHDDHSPLGRNQITVYMEEGVTVDQQRLTPSEPAAAAPKRAASLNGWTSVVGGAHRDDSQAALPSATPRLTAETWLGSLVTDQEPQVRVAHLVTGTPEMLQLFARGAAQRDPVAGRVARQAQFATAVPAAGNQVAPVPTGMRRLRAFPRSDVRVQAEWFPDPAKNEWVAVISGGVTIFVDGAGSLGSIDISADRLVLWTRGQEQPDLGGQTLQRDDTPLELYLEGNVEFRQADRFVSARSMYYDVRNHTGMVLDAEMLAPLQKFEGKLRFQANVMRQLAQDRFVAQGARFTSSRMGEPGYWIQAENVDLQDHPQPALDPRSGLPTVDPKTGQSVLDHDWTLTGQDDTVYVEGAPIFYWPTISTDLSEPGFYLKEVRFKSDNVFGFQTITDWNAYQLLGLGRPIKGTEWDLNFDYFTERGPGAGTKFTFNVPHTPLLDAPAKGVLDAFYIHDDGTDNLGQDFRSVVPSTQNRGRVLFNDRQSLGDGYQLTVEAGLISDVNFLQEYYPRDWWDNKDEDTGVELKRYNQNSSWSVIAYPQINDFFSTTAWLPRADHFWLGEPLLDDRLTWFEHSSAAYAQYRPSTIPANDPSFLLMPWEVSEDSSRFATTQELDLPMDLGPVKIVPYALGQLAHWGADLTGQPLDRAFGQVGLRASLPMWKADPLVESDLLNLHGLAHKVTFEAELSYSDANQNFTKLPLYDPIDDDSIQQFISQYVSQDFGGVLPTKFDPRYYAIRDGLGDWVTSPSTELAGELLALRLGIHQRWQTMRGDPGNLRTVDWISFDTDVVVFPDPQRDDFGSSIGLIDYDFRWHVGDRLTLLSSGIFDTFSQGQQIVNVGGLLDRPEMGSLYLGFRSIEGPISSQELIATINYRMGEKWIASYTGTIQLGGDTNATEQLTLTRIGESLLVHVGVYSDEGQGTVGAKLVVEPRFLRAARHDVIDGVHVPPAGAMGLE